jgi:hypothetical protein
MRKIKIILLIALITSSCSVLRRKRTVPEVSMERRLTLTERIRENNITRRDFNIRKAEIEIVTPELNQKLLANLKFKYPSTYLLSIRTRTGLEAARVYITEDSVMINDRINRKLFYGATGYIGEKYGISANVLPLIFGDIISNINYTEINDKCINGETLFEGNYNDKIITGTIDCRKAKMLYTRIESQLGTNAVNIDFNDFKKSGQIEFPLNISIKSAEEESVIILRINNIEFLKIEEISFVPGNRYERVLLK